VQIEPNHFDVVAMMKVFARESAALKALDQLFVFH
jgi:hypothetical protein